MTLGDFIRGSAIVAAWAILASVASAAPITLNFSGKLTDGFGSLNAGDAFSGSYTFDPSIAAAAGSNSSQAVFDNLFAASVTIGGFSAKIGPSVGLGEIQQDNNVLGIDRYALVADGATGSSLIGGLAVSFFGFRLNDPTQTAIGNALSLLTNPSLGDFASNGFFLFLGQPGAPNFTVVDGTLSTLVVTVPEPATWMLLGLALVAIGVVRSRRAV
jgi:hypothetical protein